MKKIYCLLIIITIFFSSCEIRGGEIENNNNTSPTHSVNIITSSPISTPELSDNNVFSESNYTEIKELNGYKLNRVNAKINKQQLFDWFKRIKAIGNRCTDGRWDGLALLDNGILLSYPFYWLSITNDSFENDEYIEVQYDIFPEILSDNVIINSIEVSSKEMTESSYSLVDKEKGIIFIVQSIKNETVITKAIKFNDPSKLQNINITFAYYDIDQHHMVIFTDKNVDYLIRIDNFEQEDKRVNGNWETASGYYSDYDKSYILSQINYSERKTRM